MPTCRARRDRGRDAGRVHRLRRSRRRARPRAPGPGEPAPTTDSGDADDGPAEAARAGASPADADPADPGTSGVPSVPGEHGDRVSPDTTGESDGEPGVDGPAVAEQAPGAAHRPAEPPGASGGTAPSTVPPAAGGRTARLTASAPVETSRGTRQPTIDQPVMAPCRTPPCAGRRRHSHRPPDTWARHTAQLAGGRVPVVWCDPPHRHVVDHSARRRRWTGCSVERSPLVASYGPSRPDLLASLGTIVMIPGPAAPPRPPRL